MIDCVVAPFDQTLLELEEDVRTTLPPEQNVVAPLVVITGVEGTALAVTVVPVDVEVQVPLLTVTEYVPEADTVMDCVVAPFDHVFPEAADDVRITLFPTQKEVAPLAEMVGVAGEELTVIVVGTEA